MELQTIEERSFQVRPGLSRYHDDRDKQDNRVCQDEICIFSKSQIRSLIHQTTPSFILKIHRSHQAHCHTEKQQEGSVDADNRRTFGGDISIFTPGLDSGVGVFIFSPGIEAVLKIIITSVEAGGEIQGFSFRENIFYPKHLIWLCNKSKSYHISCVVKITVNKSNSSF